MARLPTPGGDNGDWGDILNNFLDVVHNNDGSLKNDSVGTNQLQSGAVTNVQLDGSTQSAVTKANNSVQSVNNKNPDGSGNVSLSASDVTAIPSSQLGANNGVAQLDGSGALETSQLPGSVVNASLMVDIYQAGARAGVDCASIIQGILDAELPAYVPPGIAFEASSITMNPGSVILGVGAGTYGGSGFDGRTSSLKLVDGTNDHLIKGPTGALGCRIQDIELDGNAANQTSACDIIHLDDVSTGEEAQWNIDRIWAHDGYSYNLYVGNGRRDSKVLRSVFESAGTACVRVKGSDTKLAYNILCSAYTGSGAILDATVLWLLYNDIFGNNTGITLNGTEILVHGNGLDQNNEQAIWVDSGSDYITLSQNTFHSNSTKANNGYPDVNVQCTTGRVKLDGNTFGPLDTGITTQTNYAVLLADGATVQWGDNTYAPGSRTSGLTNNVSGLVRQGDMQRAWRPAGAQGWSVVERATASSGIGNLTSGRLQATAGFVPAGATVSNITFVAASAAVTPTHQWFVLLDQNLNVLGTTADDGTTAWNEGSKTLALADPITFDVDTPVYFGVCVVASTTPKLYGINATNADADDISPTLAPICASGLTTPGSLSSPATQTSASNAPYYAYAT